MTRERGEAAVEDDAVFIFLDVDLMPGVDDFIGFGHVGDGVEGGGHVEVAEELALAEGGVVAVVVGEELFSAVEVAVHFHGVHNHAVLLFHGLGADVGAGSFLGLMKAPSLSEA